MTSVERTYQFYNRSPDYLRRLEEAGWRPEYGAVLGALGRFGQQPAGKALDYGCGVGDLTATLARAGYWATGVDISLPFVEKARDRYPQLAFVAMDAGARLPFPSRSLAVITTVNTIEHVAQPAVALAELARALAPGGLLIMTFPNLLSPLRPLKRFLSRRRRNRYGPETGESTLDSLALLVRNMALLAVIGLTHQPRFHPRNADFAHAEQFRLLGYGADYDAVWLSNPLDIVWHLRNLGLQVLEVQGIPGAAERSQAINALRQILPPPLTSPVLLVARRSV